MSSLDLSVQSTFVTLLLIFSFTAVEAQLQPELCEEFGEFENKWCKFTALY